MSSGPTPARPTFVFRGHRWTLQRRSADEDHADGWCLTSGPRKLFISDRTRRSELIRIAIHEVLHALNPEWTEKAVNQTSKEWARLMRTLGIEAPDRRRKEHRRHGR